MVTNYSEDYMNKILNTKTQTGVDGATVIVVGLVFEFAGGFLLYNGVYSKA